MSASSTARERPHDRVVLGAVVHLRPAPHAGRVDEPDRSVFGLDDGVDRVARRARHVVHDCTLVADQAVEERRLADVRATDDRDAGDVGPVLVNSSRGSTSGKSFDELVEQIAGAEAVQRRHREGLAQAERHERPDVAAPRFAVDLVRDQQHRALRSPQPLGDARVLFGDADRGVDDEDHRVGLAHGALRLRAHLLVERGSTREPPARVDDAELGALPLRVERLAVAGDTRKLLDDRVAATHHPVHERRLADVRPSDDGDDGEAHGGAHAGAPTGTPSAARSATPSVAMTSTGRGRSAGVEPSRNLPSERHTSGQEVAVTMRLVREHASEIGSDEQTGDADVAAEELVAHRHDTHVVATELVDERREDPRAVLPRQDRDRRIPPRQERDGAGRLHDSRRAVALGRSAVDPREEARRDAGGLVDETVHLELEGAGHPDAVFVHREALVRVGFGEGSVCEQVVLVGEERDAPAEHTEEHLLPPRHEVDDGARLVGRV